jgi:hypothetical protein
MINIEDNFNYLQITDTTDRLNPRIAMYPKKSTTFDIVLSPIENDFDYELDGNTRGNLQLHDGSDFNSTDTATARDGEGEATALTPGEGEGLPTPIDPIGPIGPIGPINDNRNIYIRRSGGGILLSAKLFAEMKIFIGGRSSSIDDVINFLSENTSI